MEQMDARDKHLNANIFVNRKLVKRSYQSTWKISVHLFKSDIFESFSQQESQLKSPSNPVTVST